ncbi:hypothetical protein P4O66_017182, partial [Electrophorus voltai]
MQRPTGSVPCQLNGQVGTGITLSENNKPSDQQQSSDNVHATLAPVQPLPALMSSEEKILDPSDKGPSPPLSSSVATPTGSPAPIDKRPRGRPRKDALSAAAQPPLLPRQRKKSRCRGKAVLEDEDSTDGMELAEAGSTQEP